MVRPLPLAHIALLTCSTFVGEELMIVFFYILKYYCSSPPDYFFFVIIIHFAKFSMFKAIKIIGFPL